MSTGGIFTLITNDGRQDRVLMANDLLTQRLATISQERERQGMDPTPTLLDIEKTHVLFMNAHFKPFAAIGFEYNKVRNSAGTVTLGTTVQFSIPQFGDFFHDMVLHVKLGAVSAATNTHTWRWVSWPGERLCSRTKFLVNGNILDEYFSDDYAFYRQFTLKNDKLAGYQRCMGQQTLIPAQVVPLAGTALNTAATGLFGAAGAGVAESTGVWVNVSDGYQTVKNHTAASSTTADTGHVRTDILEVTVPLMFWFNENPQLAIPSVSIPFGQRYLEFELAQLSDLAAGVVVNGVGTTNSTAAALSISGTQIQTCDLYVNNIFVNPEVHTIFIRRVGFNLIRVHRRQVFRVQTTSSGDILLNSLKWPIETIFFGFRDMTRNGDQTGYVYLDNWHSFGQAHAVTNGITFNAADDSDLNVQYNKLLPVVQTVSFSAHGIPLYNDMPAILLNQYIPWAYGNGINTPTDPGAYCVTFNLYPGVYQPSGHINISRAREFYIKFSNAVSAGRNLGSAITNADFVASARALNFLLISDGSAVLRYST